MAFMMETGGPVRGRPVLVADDDANLRSSVRTALERDGFRVIEAADGVEALISLRSVPDRPDLAVLAISMPRLNGLDLVRELRAAGDPVPVIFLTSRDEELDRVLGLELGADDYLPKPFSLRELVARIRAVLRRSAVRSSVLAPGGSIAAEEGRGDRRGPLLLRGSGALEPLGIDREGFRAFWADRELDLTVTEFRILDCLAESPGAAKSREAIIARCYPEGVYLSDRVIDCHVKRLRRKLREAGAGEDLIETIYGLGYRLRP
jgi:DNA-binding response OmpR family regulator